MPLKQQWKPHPWRPTFHRPIHGLIFLFKWVPNEDVSGSIVQDNRLDKIFFAKQVSGPDWGWWRSFPSVVIFAFSLISQGHQQCLCHPSNYQHITQLQTPWHSAGSNLRRLQGIHTDFWCQHEGSGSQQFRHNSKCSQFFCQVIMSFHADVKNGGSRWNNLASFHFRQTLFEFDSKASSKDEDTYHFVGYVPIDGRLYELDGLKDGPIDLGGIANDADWIDVVRPIIEKRIQRCGSDMSYFRRTLNLLSLSMRTGTAKVKSTSI